MNVDLNPTDLKQYVTVELKLKLGKFKTRRLLFFIFIYFCVMLTQLSSFLLEYLITSAIGAQIVINFRVWGSHNIFEMKNEKSKSNSMRDPDNRSGCHDWQLLPQ